MSRLMLRLKMSHLLRQSNHLRKQSQKLCRDQKKIRIRRKSRSCRKMKKSPWRLTTSRKKKSLLRLKFSKSSYLKQSCSLRKLQCLQTRVKSWKRKSWRIRSRCRNPIQERVSNRTKSHKFRSRFPRIVSRKRRVILNRLRLSLKSKSQSSLRIQSLPRKQSCHGAGNLSHRKQRSLYPQRCLSLRSPNQLRERWLHGTGNRNQKEKRFKSSPHRKLSARPRSLIRLKLKRQNQKL